jgi:uncharacterized repeat protein (TIGR03803 family)
VFKFTSPPTVEMTVMHNFGAGQVTDLVSHSLVPDGIPHGSLLLHNGWLYGLTSHGGINGGGTVFRISVDPSCTGRSRPTLKSRRAQFTAANRLAHPFDPAFIALAVLRATIRAMSTATYIWPMIASTTAN